MNYQGKIIRQFWGKGGCLTNQNGSLATFFHNVRRIE